MAVPSGQLLGELKKLTRGRGIHTADIGDRIGPALKALAEISDQDASAVIQRKLAVRLRSLAEMLPEELGLAVMAALALHPEARQAFLQGRIDWLAAQIGRESRTARRRVEEGMTRLAESALYLVDSPRGEVDPADQGWYVESFQALLRLDSETPEAMEQRRIVAERDGVDKILIMLALPGDRADRDISRDMIAEVLYGGRLVEETRPSQSLFRFVLRLPRTLRVGEQHEYGLIFRIPPGQPMRSHYVFTPTRRCDSFDLRVRFKLERSPKQVWRIAGAVHRQIDDSTPSDHILLPDTAGEVRVQFRDLRPGLGYGVQWIASDSYSQ
jgi:hypothetical protein